MKKEQSDIAKIPNYSLSSSEDTLHLATDLANFIREKRLTTKVQGKDHVNVEGWQYAGMRLGLVPVVQSIEDVSTDTEIKYKAHVTIIKVDTGLVVGAGFAVCSNKEQGKKNNAEFAIASMAQTRAIGKGFRNLLSWIIKAAGYEPTPSEEMDYTVVETVTEKPVKLISKEQLTEISNLMKHEAVTDEQRAKASIEVLQKLTYKRAEEAIENLKKQITNY